MSKYKIYSKDGLTERCTVKKLEYNGTFMGERSISINIESSSPIQFDIYDYINYRGEKFELDYLPSENKKSTSNSVGDAFVYDLRFVSLAYELERCQMRDYVPFDNGVHYPSPLTIDFTGKASNLAERIQVCLDRLYAGNNRWEIRVVNDSENEKNISISQTNCWSVLSLFNTEFGLNYYITGRVVVVGDTDSVIDYVFRFGKGNGLYSIERTTESEKGIVTRLIAFGGSTNLGDNYLRNKNIWPDSTLPASIYIPNLMLPNFETTGIDYVESESVSRYGVREGVIIFEDVYPTIVGMKNSKGEEIDKLRSVEEITDETKSTFWITTYDLEFPNGLSTYIIDSAIPTINIKTGTLQGYGFEIASKGIEQLEDGSYKITLNKNTDNGFTVPNGDLNLSAGDKFVFTGITMPKTYIEYAENVLLQRAKEYLDKYSITNFGYEIGLDEIFVGRNQSIYDSLYEGKRLHIQDDDLNIDENIIIQSITIQEGESYLPMFRITLNNEVSASVLNRIQGQVSQLESTVTNGFTLFKWQQDQAIRKYSKPYSLWLRDGTTEYFTVDESGEIALISVALSSYSDIIAYAQNPELPLTLPIASPSNYGLVKYDGTTLKVDEEGRLYVAAGGGGGGSGIDFTVGAGLELTTDNYLNVLFGTTANTACAGNDSRLSDARRNPYSLSWSGYSSGSYNGASSQSITIPSNTNQLTNGAGFIYDENGVIFTLSGSGSNTKYLAGNGTFYQIAYSELSGTPDLSIYMPKAGGTFTGDVNMNTGGVYPHYRVTNPYGWVQLAGTSRTYGGSSIYGIIQSSSAFAIMAGDDYPNMVIFDGGNLKAVGDVIAYNTTSANLSIPVASSSNYGIVKYDNSTIKVNSSGQLYAVSSGGGSVVSWGTSYTNYVGLNVGGTTKNISLNGHTHSGYLTSHQSIYSLSIVLNGTTHTYTPNSSSKTITIDTSSSGGSDWSGGTITSAIYKASGTVLSAYSGGCNFLLSVDYVDAIFRVAGTSGTGDKHFMFYRGSTKLCQMGAAYMYSIVSWTIGSDMRDKTRLGDVSVLDKVLNIDVFRFSRSDIEGNPTYIGVSAQNIKDYYSDVVKYDSDRDRFSVDYNAIGCIALQGVKELYTHYKGFENSLYSIKTWGKTKDEQISYLQKRVEELQNEIDNLKGEAA